jgi:hypothetical protein
MSRATNTPEQDQKETQSVNPDKVVNLEARGGDPPVAVKKLKSWRGSVEPEVQGQCHRKGKDGEPKRRTANSLAR